MVDEAVYQANAIVMQHARRSDAGFTVVEVLVGLAILSLALTVLLGAIADALQTSVRARKMAEAGLLAQSLLARVGADLPLQVGRTSGQFGNGSSWQLDIATYGDEGDRGGWPVGAYRVAATVLWSNDLHVHPVVLTTLRLGVREQVR
jgi:prepilin-type N-terminal cleavage/methylation domain-containing protein